MEVNTQRKQLKGLKAGMRIRSEEGWGRVGTAVFIYKPYAYMIS